MSAHEEKLTLEEEKEVRLFNELLDLEPERRRELIESVQAYELVMAHGKELFGE